MFAWRTKYPLSWVPIKPVPREEDKARRSCQMHKADKTREVTGQTSKQRCGRGVRLTAFTLWPVLAAGNAWVAK